MTAKAIATQASDRFSRYLHSLDFSSPLFTGGALAIFKRFGPVGLVAAAVGGYALKRHLSKPARHKQAKADSAPRTKKAKAEPK